MIRSQLSKDEQEKELQADRTEVRVRKELDGFKRNTIYCMAGYLTKMTVA